MSPDKKIDHKKIENALSRYQQTFGNDYTLVHGPLNFRGPFDLTVPNAYNPTKIDKPEETAKLLIDKRTKRLAIACIDFRQCHQVETSLKLSLKDNQAILLTNAGGASHPESKRFDVLTRTIGNLYWHSPIEEIALVVHNNKCGGHAYEDHGKTAEFFPEHPEEETVEMVESLINTRNDLIHQDQIPAKSIQVYLARISIENKFISLEKIPYGVVPEGLWILKERAKRNR